MGGRHVLPGAGEFHGARGRGAAVVDRVPETDAVVRPEFENQFVLGGKE